HSVRHFTAPVICPHPPNFFAIDQQISNTVDIEIKHDLTRALRYEYGIVTGRKIRQLHTGCEDGSSHGIKIEGRRDLCRNIRLTATLDIIPIPCMETWALRRPTLVKGAFH